MSYGGRHVSLNANNPHLTSWAMETENTVSLTANNLHLTSWSMEADNIVYLDANTLHLTSWPWRQTLNVIKRW